MEIYLVFIPLWIFILWFIFSDLYYRVALQLLISFVFIHLFKIASSFKKYPHDYVVPEFIHAAFISFWVFLGFNCAKPVNSSLQ